VHLTQGAQRVGGIRALSCSACVQVPVYRHVICGNCSIMLMYPDGAESVKCSVCHFVTGVAHSRWAGGQPPQPQPKPETVVVENPPTLDEQGNEVCMLLLRCHQCPHATSLPCPVLPPPLAEPVPLNQLGPSQVASLAVGVKHEGPAR
jgi:LSD1 subclass zinc finger protein